MSNVPESIRATAIETGERAASDCWEIAQNKPSSLSTFIVDAILPAVVAQVQGDAWDEGKQAEREFQHRPRGKWRLVVNPYREKGENNHE